MTPPRHVGIVGLATTERGIGMTRSGRLALFLSLIFIAGAVGRAPAAAQNPGAVDMDDLVASADRLMLKVPMSVYGREPIRHLLGLLNRERCDQKAIVDLGKALESAGYRRDAATAHTSFSATCGGHAPSLRTAV